MKVVFDMNVVLVVLIKFEGLLVFLIKVLDGEWFINFMSEDVFDEFILKIGFLVEKGKIFLGWEEILVYFLRGFEIVFLFISFNFCRDLDDNKWLEIFYEVGVGYIFIWDDDFLSF